MPDNFLNYIFIAVIVAVIAVGITITVRRRSAIRKNGVEADAVVSRVKEQTSVDEEGFTQTTYIYFVTFRGVDGNTVEAMLDKAPKHIKVGDRLTVKYLPEKPKYALHAE